LRIVAGGVPAVTILFSGIACCRGAGDAVRPMLTMLLVNIVNVVVSFGLSGVDFALTSVGPDGGVVARTILANPFGLSFGVRGIALGTLAAWWVGAIAMIILLARGTHGLRLRSRRLIRRLVRIGVPNFLETFGMWVGNFLTVLLVGWMGVEALYGTHIVAIRIEAFSFLPGFAMATAAATLAGQYLGAGSPALARTAIIRCTTIAAAIMCSMGAAFILIPTEIVGIFSRQASHLEVAPRLLMICGFAQLPFAVAIVVRGALRGAGDTRVVMVITLVSTWLIRLPLAWLFSGVDIPAPGGGVLLANPAPLQTHFEIHPLVGLWIGLCSEMALRPCLFLVRFFQGGWQRLKV
jgi:putative MATE family efflux protein